MEIHSVQDIVTVRLSIRRRTQIDIENGSKVKPTVEEKLNAILFFWFCSLLINCHRCTVYLVHSSFIINSIIPVQKLQKFPTPSHRYPVSKYLLYSSPKDEGYVHIVQKFATPFRNPAKYIYILDRQQIINRFKHVRLRVCAIVY